MYFIESKSNDPYFNLALEQYVFDQLDRKHGYFILWQNSNTIVVGKNQNTIEEINQKFVDENGIKVVRRLSGGGAVYHDMGNINYTFIADKEDELFDFSKFCMPVIHALKCIHVDAQLSGRNDMTINNRKFSGNSQYTKENRIMHHGTIMYDCNVDIVAKALLVSKDKFESKGHKSVRSRVTNVKEYVKDSLDTKEFYEILKSYLADEIWLNPYQLNQKDLDAIEQIKKERYSTWEWNYGKSPKYEIEKRRRFDKCGEIQVCMNVEKGYIQKLAFFGDFFSNLNSDALAKLLLDTPLKYDKIEEKLNKVNIDDYFYHLSKDEFVHLLLQ
ncbi:MAG: lipoate--protein ligase [Anaerostipes sp.]|jgi:lipoate-protein ligase A